MNFSEIVGIASPSWKKNGDDAPSPGRIAVTCNCAVQHKHHQVSGAL